MQVFIGRFGMFMYIVAALGARMFGKERSEGYLK
jgi:hypothetical protein